MYIQKIGMVALLSVGLTVSPGPLSAQALPGSVVVFYDHRPGKAPIEQRTSYLVAGERSSRDQARSERHWSRPAVLEVRKGNSACFVVENANPLLYAYAISSKAITAEAPSGLSDLTTALTVALAGTVPPTAAGQKSRPKGAVPSSALTAPTRPPEPSADKIGPVATKFIAYMKARETFLTDSLTAASAMRCPRSTSTPIP